jgi:SAM-dependent methyltransferase
MHMSQPTAYDSATLSFYGREASAYAEASKGSPSDWIARFAALLAAGAAVLELGCGAGVDTVRLLEHGFDVTPTDGSPEMAAEAQRRLGRAIAVMRFEDLEAHERYDGVWANACLLHVPEEALPRVLALIHRALKPGGAFYASFKAGSGPGRDTLGRYYNYPSEVRLRAAAEAAAARAWLELSITTTAGGGYDNKPATWLHLFAVKSTPNTENATSRSKPNGYKAK